MMTRGRPGVARALLRRSPLALLRRVPPAAPAVLAVRHVLERGLPAGRLHERARQLLLLLHDRLEEIAELGDSAQHLLRVEDEPRRIAGLEALLDLFPRHRGRDRGPA